MVSNCDEFYLVKKDDDCYNIAQKYSISLDQFYAWNPAVGTNCATLWPENYVCVSTIGVQPTKTTLVTSTAKTTSWTRPPPCWFDESKGQYNCNDPQPSPTTTKPGNGITTPTPVQSGITPNCKKFYKVVKGDGCWAIADAYKINLDEFYKWNPAVGTSCGGLYPDNYVCVGV
jgi:LysM repeat protein